ELADARCRSACDAIGNRFGGNHALRVMAVCDVDAAIGSNHDSVRLVELPVGVAGFARDPQAQQLLTLWAELVPLMTLRTAFVSGKIGDPPIALLVHGDAVRSDHHALSDVREDGARLAVEFEDRIERGVVAIDRAAAGRARAAALVRPDVSIRGID